MKFISVSHREQTRSNFSREFLLDVWNQNVMNGHDPRNWIGRRCGISFGRATQLAHDQITKG